VLNEITRAATFLRRGQIDGIIRLYKKNPNSLPLKIHLLIAKFKSALISEPLTCLQMIHLAHNGGILRTLQHAAFYSKQNIHRYLEQFKSG
jgi:hypothetical protein